MNISEGIAMADEQNQGNTIINQGTTIDNLPGLDGMTPAQKQEFIDSAFVPIRGTISGEMATRKVTGSDLAASGENKIDSVSLNNAVIPPDSRKNVNIQVAAVATTGSYNDLSDKPTIPTVPSNVSSFTNDAGYFTPNDLGDALVVSEDKLSVKYDNETILCHYDTNELMVNVSSLAGTGLAYNGSDDANNLYIPSSDTITCEEVSEGEWVPVVRLDDNSGLGVTEFNWYTKEGGLHINYDPNTLDISSNFLEVLYDDSTMTTEGNGLTVKYPIPDPNVLGDYGGILCRDAHNDIVWSDGLANNNAFGLDDLLHTMHGLDNLLDPINSEYPMDFTASGGIRIDADAANEGDVLSYNGEQIVWAQPTISGLAVPSLPTVNATGGALESADTRVLLVARCNHAENFTLTWEYLENLQP